MRHLLLLSKASRIPKIGGTAMRVPTITRHRTIPQLAPEGPVSEHPVKEYLQPLRAPTYIPRSRSIRPQEGTLRNTSLHTTLTSLTMTGHNLDR
jgi:hypothetical protein